MDFFFLPFHFLFLSPCFFFFILFQYLTNASSMSYTCHMICIYFCDTLPSRSHVRLRLFLYPLPSTVADVLKELNPTLRTKWMDAQTWVKKWIVTKKTGQKKKLITTSLFFNMKTLLSHYIFFNYSNICITQFTILTIFKYTFTLLYSHHLELFHLSK